MQTYTEARRWADKFLHQQLNQLATLLDVPLSAIIVSDAMADIAGVDVMVGSIKIALRVRRHDAFKRFGIQPTIRLSTGRDGMNELDKLKQGRLDYMLLNYATPTASEDNDDDSIMASVLIDMLPIRQAANDEFEGCKVTEIDADRAHALAINLASLMSSYGPCIVSQHVSTTTTAETTTTNAGQHGLQHRTTETETTTRTTEAHNPDLVAYARRRAQHRPAA